MSEYFESIKKGALEAIDWKQGKKTCARVRKIKLIFNKQSPKKEKL